MGTCVIFCAAEFDALLRELREDDYIIAADGGMRHVQTLGLQPHEIIGDFDSLGYVPQGANVFPVEKDDTDAMLAIRRGISLGFRSFLIYGGMDGSRIDHTVANLQSLHFLAQQGCFGILAGKHYLAAAVHNGALFFPAGAEGTVSVFCSGPDASGVNLEGLYYPLKNGSLDAAFPLGVSNHFTRSPACIQVEQGTLLVLWERSCGLPEKIRIQGSDISLC